MSALVDLAEIDSVPALRERGRRREPEAACRPAPLVVSNYSPDNPELWTNAIRRRRSIPVMGYIGTSGHGKSASLVRDTLPSLAMGRPILSTVQILDAWTGNPHPLYIPFSSFRQLEDFRDGDVNMDEITGIMDSHDSAMPKKVRRILPQLRRRGVFVRWSGIDWDNSNRRLRQMTQGVTLCRGYFPDRASVRTAAADGSTAMWAPNRLFRIRTFDAQKMMRSEDAVILSKTVPLLGTKAVRVRPPKPLVSEWWRGSTSLAFRSYDTMGDVLGVDGSCERCGGRIPDVVCKCGSH